jgi:hypothetical protein
VVIRIVRLKVSEDIMTHVFLHIGAKSNDTKTTTK